MSSYVGLPIETTNKVLQKSEDDGGKYPWYTNLGDVCFMLKAKYDGGKDYYWLSRESNLLIRGGSNYSYEAVNSELELFIVKEYGLKEGDVSVAVMGCKFRSEHEDDCWVTVELGEGVNESKKGEILASFIDKAKGVGGSGVSKGAKPDKVRIGVIPKNFKGESNEKARSMIAKDIDLQ